jgi:uncharacterized protein YkwD
VVPHPYPAPVLDSRTETNYLTGINAVRAKARYCGNEGYFSAAPALQWSDALYKAAYEHSNDMRQTGLFSHKGSGMSSDRTAMVQHLGRGSSFKERIENNGYTAWRHIAENIAEGPFDIESVLERWIRSDKHCANIMNPVFTHVGMARTKKKGSSPSSFWTQTFAAHQ